VGVHDFGWENEKSLWEKNIFDVQNKKEPITNLKNITHSC
jgi:hypothetical protein